ncbi:MAG: alpha/beta hydrolase [Faecalibacillus sp.]
MAEKKTYKGLIALTAIGATAATVVSLSNKFSKKLMYRHHKEEDRPSILESKYNAKHVYLKNKQDIKLHGMIIEKENANTTLLIAHPFGLEAKNMSMYVPYFEEHLPNANILLIDFCAHGQSDGYIRGFGIKDVQDIVLWNQYLLQTYGKQHQIIMYGKEMGANAIINASGKHLLKNVIGIISDGAFTSPYDIIGYRIVADYKAAKYPAILLIAKYIKKAIHIDIKESTVRFARHNDIPTLYFHTKNDDFVPLKMVYPLFNKNRGEKVLFILKDEKYLYELNETNDYKKTLASFIEQLQ